MRDPMRDPLRSSLPTVEDSSVGSNNSQGTGENNSNFNSFPKMKRSPYLSVMAGSTKESEDLVALLSRPAPAPEGGGLKRTSGGGTRGGDAGPPPSPGVVGRSSFFDLKRPSSGHPLATMLLSADLGSHTVTPVSSAGGEFTDEAGNNQDLTGMEGENGVSPLIDRPGGQRAGSINVGRPMPSLRSALRITSRTELKASINQGTSEMRKNTSVTFSNTTKKASNLGILNSEREEQGNARFIFPPQQQMMNSNQAANLRQFEQTQQDQRQAMQQQSGYSAAAMMKKSQSIAAPQFLLARQNSRASETSTSNEAFSQGGEGEGNNAADGNASFPIYFAKLPEKGGQPTDGDAPASPASKPASSPNHNRQRSKSYNTLQYYYQNNTVNSNAMDPAQKLLHAAGMTGITPVSRPSINGLNLTFRDMLDEGDGAEGDLNIRHRNQQWKDFRSFSSRFEADNPMMSAAAAMEEEPVDDRDRDAGTIKEASSMDSTSTAATGATSDTPAGGTNARGAIPLSGSKRTLTPTGSMGSRGGPPSRQASGEGGGNNAGALPAGVGIPIAQALAGSHRAAVSVNDLAVLRRAAARMKMNNPTSSNFDGPGSHQRRQSTTKMGETLGGDMLSRLSSVSSMAGTDSSRNISDMSRGAPGAPSTANLSPLAQMMAKTSMNRPASAAGGNGAMGAGDGFASQSQRDLFLQKFNMALTGTGQLGGGDNPSASPSRFGLAPSASTNMFGGGGMGRRVRTVGAGLAYGRQNMYVDSKSGLRMSKFNLGDLQKETSRLSEISSAGSSGGKNEEWELS